MKIPDWKLMSVPFKIGDNQTRVSIVDNRSNTILYAEFKKSLDEVREWSDDKLIEKALDFGFKHYFKAHAEDLINEEMNNRLEFIEGNIKDLNVEDIKERIKEAEHKIITTSTMVIDLDESVTNMKKDLNTVSKTVLRSEISDDEYEEIIKIYDEWQVGIAYEKGDIVRFEGKAYEVQDYHTSTEQFNPIDADYLFFEIRYIDEDDVEVIPDYKDPAGYEEAYNKGDKVMFEGEIWVCTKDGTTWSPTVAPNNWELEFGIRR